MTGVILNQLGHHVRIFERYPSTHIEGQGAGIMAQTDVQQLLADCGLLKPPYSIPEAQMTNWNTLRFRLRATFDGHTSEYCSQAPEAQQTGSGEGIYEHGRIVTDVKSVLP